LDNINSYKCLTFVLLEHYVPLVATRYTFDSDCERISSEFGLAGNVNALISSLAFVASQQRMRCLHVGEVNTANGTSLLAVVPAPQSAALTR
jgi:hypothetical protein